MRLYRFCLASAAAALCITAAQAQEARVDLHGGYSRVSNPDYFGFPGFDFDANKGAAYGLGLGYDVPIGDRWFAGIDASADMNSGTQCQVNPLVLAPGIFESCFAPKRDLSANARLGVTFNDQRTRIYALAGYSNLRVTSSWRLNRGAPSGVVSNNRDGIRLGAGIEQSLGGRFFGKLEYRFSDYDAGFRQDQILAGIGLRFGKQ